MNACSLKPLLNISSASSSTNIFMRFTCLTSNSAQWSVATKLDLSDFEMPLLDHAQDLHMQQLGDVFKITKAMPSHTSGSSRDDVNPWAEKACGNRGTATALTRAGFSFAGKLPDLSALMLSLMLLPPMHR